MINKNTFSSILSSSLSDFEEISENSYYLESIPTLIIQEAFFPGKGLYQDERLDIYSGHHLPHWELESIVYHVCFRLADSVPVAQQRQWLEERNQLLIACTNENRTLTKEEKATENKCF